MFFSTCYFWYSFGDPLPTPRWKQCYDTTESAYLSPTADISEIFYEISRYYDGTQYLESHNYFRLIEFWK